MPYCIWILRHITSAIESTPAHGTAAARPRVRSAETPPPAPLAPCAGHRSIRVPSAAGTGPLSARRPSRIALRHLLQRSYIAVRSLHQLATDEGARCPPAARVLFHAFYVHDLLWSMGALDVDVVH
ncbi:hypothetical protein EVAR_63309_1 [Eumeta japonica]|uniref:Uncharacterized protein n=1 Tax=Eumeta variegata TaxID=151549 RepID=A0A4C1YPY5_EUMVA|nr:hypothetical protein EVAR_63309_1 [Eumeta japonica]